MGMLATVMNALALADTMNKQGLTAARDVRHRDRAGRRAVRAPEGAAVPRGRQVVISRRHGNPFFTTDTAPRCAARRIGAEVVLSRPPRWTACTPPTRRRTDRAAYGKITFDEAMARTWGSWMRRRSRCARPEAADQGLLHLQATAPCGAW